MIGYTELAKLNTFNMSHVFKLTGNKKTASSLVLRLSKKGMVKKIKNNLYTCVNLSNGQVIASKYHIACSVNDTSYISHHTAFEYMGLSNQIFYEIYVSSVKKFSDFVFEGITYKYVPSKLQIGIISPKNSEGIKITSLERTLIDSIKDFEKIGGLDELLNCLSAISYLNENQILEILNAYDLKYLYQKTGYILYFFKNQFDLSTDFFDFCKSKIGKSTRYLTKDSKKYIKDWQLIVPEYISETINQGEQPLV
ncbi:MAG: type IV toxin-antitoxin system AbiEi family antitoxin domain-containing protein [Candidatus Muiribacteriota bacterium]